MPAASPAVSQVALVATLRLDSAKGSVAHQVCPSRAHRARRGAWAEGLGDEGSKRHGVVESGRVRRRDQDGPGLDRLRGAMVAEPEYRRVKIAPSQAS